MTNSGDSEARLRVLTDLSSTLLVEAAAGTGKTALIAGRLTMLLACGTEPASIAAISFTELAASELSLRVQRFVEELVAGNVPGAMKAALPQGLDIKKRNCLIASARKLDELTTTTIHGFCQTVIQGYSVEADIDPGARVLDASQAEAVFDGVFERWLRRRLTGPARSGDPIAALSRENPRRVVSTLQGLARFRLNHRTARPVPADLTGSPDVGLTTAVSEYREWISRKPIETKTLEVVCELETLARFYAGAFDPSPDFTRLWELAHPPRLACMRSETFDLIVPSRKSAWVCVAGPTDGSQLSEESSRLFNRVNECYRAVLGRIATALVEVLSSELDEVLREYGEFKRAAAVLDFEDLLQRARSLVSEHDDVRRALGSRYQHILIDEFQDTDPVQAELLFLIASEQRAGEWYKGVLRPGAIFLVGDPKQAIYQFRGANVRTYSLARSAIEQKSPRNIIQITDNFRSRPGILTHVNRCFAQPLSGIGQPGYVALTPTIPAPDHGLPCVAKVTIDVPPEPRAEEIRDAEAAAIAEICARLIGNMKVRGPDNALVPLGAGDIALLAPTGTELWRYERALEQRQLPIASQAGKGFFRRQEVQDLLALGRTLADRSDTVAFGALMRGPLVGLTEEELLDITSGLSVAEASDTMPRFSLSTDPAQVSHTVARQVLVTLQQLERRSRETTPSLVLAEAIERLAVRAILSSRENDRGSRAASNIDVFLELARVYDIKGLRRFVRDMTKEWEIGSARSEGRVDAEGSAIEIVTMHSSKGLEWPVVIPVNSATLVRSREQFVYRAADDTVHWVIGDVIPPDLASALRSDEESLARERERLWYVACTRAKELLIVPEIPAAGQRSWARIVRLTDQDLPELDVSRFGYAPFTPASDMPNLQTADLFEDERRNLGNVCTSITWSNPSDYDPDRVPVKEIVALDYSDVPEAEMPIAPGRLRGVTLHKLMEEVLAGELLLNESTLSSRAVELLSELPINGKKEDALPSADEIASIVIKTLKLPEIADLRPTLVPELPLFALGQGQSANATVALAGRADAVGFENGEAVVLDWKSDVAPTSGEVRAHADQLRRYMTELRAARGALVYMTLGVVHWVT